MKFKMTNAVIAADTYSRKIVLKMEIVTNTTLLILNFNKHWHMMYEKLEVEVVEPTRVTRRKIYSGKHWTNIM